MVQGRQLSSKSTKNQPPPSFLLPAEPLSSLSVSFSTAAFSRQNLHHREPPLASPWSASTATTREQRRRTEKQRDGAEKTESNREEEKNKNRQQQPFATTTTPPRAATSTTMSASFFFFIFTASTILQMNNGEYLHCLLGRRCPAQTKIVGPGPT